jgi:hypothetical protein
MLQTDFGMHRGRLTGVYLFRNYVNLSFPVLCSIYSSSRRVHGGSIRFQDLQYRVFHENCGAMLLRHINTESRSLPAASALDYRKQYLIVASASSTNLLFARPM